MRIEPMEPELLRIGEALREQLLAQVTAAARMDTLPPEIDWEPLVDLEELALRTAERDQWVMDFWSTLTSGFLPDAPSFSPESPVVAGQVAEDPHPGSGLVNRANAPRTLPTAATTAPGLAAPMRAVGSEHLEAEPRPGESSGSAAELAWPRGPARAESVGSLRDLARAVNAGVLPGDLAAPESETVTGELAVASQEPAARPPWISVTGGPAFAVPEPTRGRPLVSPPHTGELDAAETTTRGNMAPGSAPLERSPTSPQDRESSRAHVRFPGAAPEGTWAQSPVSGGAASRGLPHAPHAATGIAASAQGNDTSEPSGWAPPPDRLFIRPPERPVAFDPPGGAGTESSFKGPGCPAPAAQPDRSRPLPRHGAPALERFRTLDRQPALRETGWPAGQAGERLPMPNLAAVLSDDLLVPVDWREAPEPAAVSVSADEPWLDLNRVIDALERELECEYRRYYG